MTGLVADIGGTNVRFALVAEGSLAPLGERAYEVRNFPDVAAAAQHYFAEEADLLGSMPALKHGAFAVAGKVIDNCIDFTNNDWAFSGEEVAATLGLKQIDLINDYTAKALSLPHLEDAHIAYLGDVRFGAAAPSSSDRAVRVTSVLGPGTGLGVSALVAQGGVQMPLATEGGHVGFTPEGDFEIAIIRHLRRVNPHWGRVSVERVLSGDGLLSLYQTIGALEDKPAPLAKAADVSQAGQDGGDALARAALDVFCGVLGSVAGDVALMHGTTEGIYIGGGIPPKILEFLKESDFRTRFEKKGRFRKVMENLPTAVITLTSPAKLGCAAYLQALSD